MKKLNLTALLLGAALFMAVGTTTLSAEAMKCGDGKCGASMSKPATKCGADKKDKAKCNLPECNEEKKANDGKCGGDKKAPAKPAKCGTEK
ncbi:hypothetical protein KKG72_01105 [bacterium]|nr:hypothetical protein [bacterium]MBU1994915.1 hypothetical protein [bacterium]